MPVCLSYKVWNNVSSAFHTDGNHSFSRLYQVWGSIVLILSVDMKLRRQVGLLHKAQIHGSKPGQERVHNMLTLADDITWFPGLFLSFLEISKQSCIRFYEFLFSKQIYVFYFRSGTCFHSLSGSRCSDAFSSLVVCPVFHHVVLAGSGQWGKL